VRVKGEAVRRNVGSRLPAGLYEARRGIGATARRSALDGSTRSTLDGSAVEARRSTARRSTATARRSIAEPCEAVGWRLMDQDVAGLPC